MHVMAVLLSQDGVQEDGDSLVVKGALLPKKAKKHR